SHLDYLGFPLAMLPRRPMLSTLHGRLDVPSLWPIYRAFADLPLVSISDAQRRPLAAANWQSTVYHGIDLDQLTFNPKRGESLACGTPVLALRQGSVPEVIEDGVTGFVRHFEDDLVDAVGRLAELDRYRCRSEAERRFSPSAMADAYESVYARILERSLSPQL